MEDHDNDQIQQEQQAAKKAKQAACAHENTHREKISGQDTGDKICDDCGKLI